MFSNASGTQSQQKEDQDNKADNKLDNKAGQPNQTIFNNVKTQNNIYINAGPATGIANTSNKINFAKDNAD